MAGIKLKQFMGILLNGNENKLITHVRLFSCKFPKMKDDTPFRRAFKEYVRETKRDRTNRSRKPGHISFDGIFEIIDGGMVSVGFDVNDFNGDIEDENIAYTLWWKFIFEKNPEIKIVFSGGSNGCDIATMKPITMPDISDAAEAILKQNPGKYGFNYKF